MPSPFKKGTKEYGRWRYEVYGREWHQRNRKRRIAAVTRRRADPKVRAEINRRAREVYTDRYRAKKLAKIYNISVEQAEALLEIKVCGVCPAPATDIDHCHESGRVRGRLCGKCNRAIGLAEDCPVRLRALAAYVEAHGTAHRL